MARRSNVRRKTQNHTPIGWPALIERSLGVNKPLFYLWKMYSRIYIRCCLHYTRSHFETISQKYLPQSYPRSGTDACWIFSQNVHIFSLFITFDILFIYLFFSIQLIKSTRHFIFSSLNSIQTFEKPIWSLNEVFDLPTAGSLLNTFFYFLFFSFIIILHSV